VSASFVEEFVTQLGFVLAVDGCQRGCRNCPAFGSTAPVQRADLFEIEDRLRFLADLRVYYGLSGTYSDTIHCWRISDPLDYIDRLPRGSGVATVADLATLWREYLHQGLYVVTNGSEGRRYAQRALRAFAAAPRLVSQVKLTITPADREWGTAKYIENMTSDLRTLLPLWDYPVDRLDGNLDDRRLRLNVTSTSRDRAQARSATADIMRAAGVKPALIPNWLDDPRRVAFKPIYDPGTSTGEPTPVEDAIAITTTDRQRSTPSQWAQHRYGIRPNGNLFKVDMCSFTETDLHKSSGGPYTIDQIRAGVTRAGWV